MKKICAYCAVLLVLAVFALTIFAHAGDLPPVPLTEESNSGIPEVSTDFEVPISFPIETEPLTANDAVTWKSSNDAVVKVDPENGSLYAAGRGTATVTATTEDGRTASCTVTVQYTWWQWLIRIFLFGWIWY